MTTCNTVKKVALVVALGGLFAWQASAIVAYSMPNSVDTLGLQGPTYAGTYVLGNDFKVGAQNVTVTAVGAFDYGKDGWSPGMNVSVAIYQLSAGSWNMVSGTAHTFSGTPSPGSYVGSDTFFNLGTSVTLLAGQTYSIVAANYGSTGSANNPDWNSTVNPGLRSGQLAFTSSTLISQLAGRWAMGSSLPGSGWAGGTAGNFNFGAGTFEFTAVPEAAGFALAGVALLGLVYVGRCYSLKLKLA